MVEMSSTGTSFWSTLLPPRLSRLLRMQMGTNLTNSTHSESTSSLTLTSMFVGFNNKDRNSNNEHGEKNVFFSPLRYMNISDEWETPEKQPFKDFVSIYFLHFILVCFFRSEH